VTVAPVSEPTAPFPSMARGRGPSSAWASRKPPFLLYSTELWRSSIDAWATAAWAPILATAPRGDRHPVLVLPGFMTNDRWTTGLRASVRSLGYHAHGWRLGRNIGPTDHILNGLTTRLDHLADRYGEPVSLLGWSLGGIYARRLARQSPDKVRQVITLGSPIRLQRHDQSWASPLFNRYAAQHAEELGLPLERDTAPLTVPATSIYSRLDGIVAWQTCLDLPGKNAENIAVWSSHFGFGHNPAALWAVADRLAQPADRWHRFSSPALLRAAYPTVDVARP